MFGIFKENFSKTIQHIGPTIWLLVVGGGRGGGGVGGEWVIWFFAPKPLVIEFFLLPYNGVRFFPALYAEKDTFSV